MDYTRPTALLLGSELRGVSAEAAALADRHAILPMRGLAASLNVSVAAALFLYEAARQREAAGLYADCRLSAGAVRADAVRVVSPGHRGALPDPGPALPAADGRRRPGGQSVC